MHRTPARSGATSCIPPRTWHSVVPQPGVLPCPPILALLDNISELCHNGLEPGGQGTKHLCKNKIEEQVLRANEFNVL